MDRFESPLAEDPDVTRWSSYVGEGAIRFYLPLDQQLANPFYGQVVIEAKSIAARDRLLTALQEFGIEQFVGTDVFVHPLDLGPPVGRPVQYRAERAGHPDPARQGSRSRRVMAGNPHLDATDLRLERARQGGEAGHRSAVRPIVGESSLTFGRRTLATGECSSSSASLMP